MACSVLLPVYEGDNPGFLHEALDSIVSQSQPVGEVVIVFDGPVPDTLCSVINEFDDLLPIKKIHLESNVGLGAALNVGLESCAYPLVMRMDADDICQAERVSDQVTFMDSHVHIDILGSFAIEIDANGAKGRLRKMPIFHSEIMASLWTCPLLHPTVMFRKEKVLAIGGYDASLRRRQDYELWFRCAKAGLVFENLSQPLLLYRFHSGAHKKQPPRLSFQQGVIGFKGASALDMPYWQRLACFAPFIRSLMPTRFQHAMYRLMRRFDPRQS